MKRAVVFRGRLAPAALVSFTLVLGACGETSTGPTEQVSPRLAPQAAIVSSVTWTGRDMTLALGNSATGLFFMAPFASEVTWFGSGVQTAILRTSGFGFPTEGPTFVSVSSGLAATPGEHGGSGVCSGSPTRCNIGGVKVPIQIPSSTRTLSMDVRYWATDYLPFLDPFRIYIEMGTARTMVFEATVQSEFGGGSGFRFAPRRTVTIDMTPYRNRKIVLVFEASDLLDTALPAGAFIDNVRLN
jgi:hypothetical protein